MWILNAQIIGHPNPNASRRLHALQFDSKGALIGIYAEAHPTADECCFDLGEDYLSLGGVDLQINGALGLAFPDLTLEQGDRLSTIGHFLWEQGINAYAPTLVTTSIENFQRALKSFAAYPTPTTPEARILGVHLEGPCLNPQKRGAHPEAFLQPLTPEVMATVIGDHGEQVAIVTLAPELDPSGKTIQYLKRHLPDNAVVSLGHSLASDQAAEQAFEAGATMVTHAFNAMPPLHHRTPGLLTTALTTPQVWSGVIADGQHVVPRMLKLLLQTRPHDGLFLVSDALSPLGLPDGDYPWDDRTITVTQGTAKLPDGTLSGTTRPLLDGVKNLVKWGCCSPRRAIALATEAPRQAMGLPQIQSGLQLNQFLRWTYHPDHQELTWERLSEQMFGLGY